MSNSMDNELFELCKEVSKLSGFEGYGTTSAFTPEGEIVDNFKVYQDDLETVCPLYTSDYLLEKLKPVMHEWNLSFNFFKNRWELNHVRFGREIGDTPLKSLLKLTLALHEAGEL